MPKKYREEEKQRAKDYVQVHGYTFEKVEEIMDIPSSTTQGWSKTDPEGKWIKGKYKDKIDDIAEEMRKEMEAHPIWKTVKDRMIAEQLAERPDMMTLAVEDKVIIENRTEALIMEAMSIENFDLMALEGVQLANKKLRYLKLQPNLKNVPMGEIKLYNDIVANVKNQIHGKAPDTIINIANQNNLQNQIDYSAMEPDELMNQLAELEKKEKIEEAKSRV